PRGAGAATISAAWMTSTDTWKRRDKAKVREGARLDAARLVGKDLAAMNPGSKPRNVHGLIALALALAACLGEACSKPSEGPAQAAPGPVKPDVGARRTAIPAGAEGYAPATVDAKKGEQVVLVFTRTTKSDCLAEVVIPDLNIKKDLPLNTPVE